MGLFVAVGTAFILTNTISYMIVAMPHSIAFDDIASGSHTNALLPGVAGVPSLPASLGPGTQ